MYTTFFRKVSGIFCPLRRILRKIPKTVGSFLVPQDVSSEKSMKLLRHCLKNIPLPYKGGISRLFWTWNLSPPSYIRYSLKNRRIYSYCIKAGLRGFWGHFLIFCWDIYTTFFWKVSPIRKTKARNRRPNGYGPFKDAPRFMRPRSLTYLYFTSYRRNGKVNISTYLDAYGHFFTT